MSDCVFCDKLLKGEDEHGRVYGTSVYRVSMFEPLNPVTEGHMLFVHDAHFSRAEDANVASGQIVEALVSYAKSEGIKAYNIIQSNGVEATQTVPHVHFHLVPRRAGDGLKLPWST